MKKTYRRFLFSIGIFFAFLFFLQFLLAIQHHSISSYLKLEEFPIERRLRIQLKEFFLNVVDSLRKREIAWMQEKIREVIPEYDQLDDFEKVRRIREWVHSWVDNGGSRKREHYSALFVRFKPIYSSYEGFEKDELSVYCTGTAMALYKVYRLLGFPARTYGFGFSPSSDTHVLTLVRVQGKEYIQDADGNYEILDEKGEPLDFGELLFRLQSQRDDFQIYTRKQIKRDQLYGKNSFMKTNCLNKRTIGNFIICKNFFSLNIQEYFREELSKRGLRNYHSLYVLFYPLMDQNRQHYMDILREYLERLKSKNNRNL